MLQGMKALLGRYDKPRVSGEEDADGCLFCGGSDTRGGSALSARCFPR